MTKKISFNTLYIAEFLIGLFIYGSYIFLMIEGNILAEFIYSFPLFYIPFLPVFVDIGQLFMKSPLVLLETVENKGYLLTLNFINALIINLFLYIILNYIAKKIYNLQNVNSTADTGLKLHDRILIGFLWFGLDGVFLLINSNRNLILIFTIGMFLIQIMKAIGLAILLRFYQSWRKII